jgi:hypothetical protein
MKKVKCFYPYKIIKHIVLVLVFTNKLMYILVILLETNLEH